MDSQSATRLLKRQEVEHMTGMSRAYIYKSMLKDTFPQVVHIGDKAVRWNLQDVQAWIAARIAGKDVAVSN